MCITATSLETLCNTLKLSPLFAFKLIAKNNDEKKSNNVGDPPKLMIFHFVRLFISRIKGKKGRSVKQKIEKSQKRKSGRQLVHGGRGRGSGEEVR
jgi:hypothetical protein